MSSDVSSIKKEKINSYSNQIIEKSKQISDSAKNSDVKNLSTEEISSLEIDSSVNKENDVDKLDAENREHRIEIFDGNIPHESEVQEKLDILCTVLIEKLYN